MERRRVFDTWGLALLLACAGVAGAPRPARADDQTAARQAIQAAMQRYAELGRTGPVAATVAMFTADGELLEPGMPPIQGRPAIQSFLAPLAAKFTVESEVMTTDALDIYGSAAYQWGTYQQTAGPIGQPGDTYAGRYVAEWRHEPGGQWRLRRLMMQPVQAPRKN
ncbi:MAG TPA: DUF4440 domain-containing protein [Vicinamibacterales bacterium]|nr:DUF4440 domain-containing protein [Vicinamibacterales bacterium]